MGEPPDAADRAHALARELGEIYERAQVEYDRQLARAAAAAMDPSGNWEAVPPESASPELPRSSGRTRPAIVIRGDDSS